LLLLVVSPHKQPVVHGGTRRYLLLLVIRDYKHLWYKEANPTMLRPTDKSPNLSDKTDPTYIGCGSWIVVRNRGWDWHSLRACLVRVRVRMVLYATSYEKDISN
jgi:hypothetical protein